MFRYHSIHSNIIDDDFNWYISGVNPGVTLRPAVDGYILFDNTNSSTYDIYINELKDFFSGKSYRTSLPERS